MILVFGANSFIARNFVDHCEKNGIEYLGVGSTGNDTDIRNYRNTSYTSEDIEYIPTGIILNIRPRISDNSNVSLVTFEYIRFILNPIF